MASDPTPPAPPSADSAPSSADSVPSSVKPDKKSILASERKYQRLPVGQALVRRLISLNRVTVSPDGKTFANIEVQLFRLNRLPSVGNALANELLDDLSAEMIRNIDDMLEYLTLALRVQKKTQVFFTEKSPLCEERLLSSLIHNYIFDYVAACKSGEVVHDVTLKFIA